jgi:hypothetical protein
MGLAASSRSCKSDRTSSWMPSTPTWRWMKAHKTHLSPRSSYRPR